MSQLLNLYRLQHIDSQVDQAKARINQIEAYFNQQKAIKDAQALVDQATLDYKEKKAALKQVEDQIEAQNIKYQQNQSALFSGRFNNPKDLKDLEDDSAAVKRFIAKLEEDQFACLMAFEAATKTLKINLKRLELTRGKVAEKNAALLGEKITLETALEKLSAEHAAILPSINPEILAQYETLRQSKRGVAVATVTDGCCDGCGNTINPGDLQVIRSQVRFVRCSGCGRILYCQ